MKGFSDYGISIPCGKTTGKIKTFCPQCHTTRNDQRDKSLSVDLDKGLWNCHYCGWSGKLEHTDEEKQDWMKQQPWFNTKPIRKEKPTYKRPQPKPHNPMSERALKWFAGRGISQSTLEALKVTEGLEFMPQNNAESNTVQFNYYLNGELINTKFRTGDKKFKMVSGAELLPYNLDGIKGTKECIITEGEMDALSFYECGRHDVVSVPNGANANLTYLDDYIEDYFDDKDTIYIASDTDTKGVLLRDELIRRFGVERCRVLEYGEGCKDANEHLQKYGKDSLLQCIANAPEIKVEGVFSVSDFELDSIHLALVFNLLFQSVVSPITQHKVVTLCVLFLRFIFTVQLTHQYDVSTVVLDSEINEFTAISVEFGINIVVFLFVPMFDCLTLLLSSFATNRILVACLTTMDCLLYLPPTIVKFLLCTNFKEFHPTIVFVLCTNITSADDWIEFTKKCVHRFLFVKFLLLLWHIHAKQEKELVSSIVNL